MKLIFASLSILLLIGVSLPAQSAGLSLDKLEAGLRKADAKAEAIVDKIDSGPVGDFFKSFFGLTYLGSFWEKQCGKIGGEWDASVPECRKNLFD